MKYDFDYYSGADIVKMYSPVRPVKPKLQTGHSVEDVVTYAKLLEQYTKDFDAYQKQTIYLSQRRGARVTELQNRLCYEYNITKKQFDILWKYAEDVAHSYGLEETVARFAEYHAMMTEYNSVE